MKYKFFDTKKKKFVTGLFISEDGKVYDAYNDEFPKDIQIYQITK